MTLCWRDPIEACLNSFGKEVRCLYNRRYLLTGCNGKVLKGTVDVVATAFDHLYAYSCSDVLVTRESTCCIVGAQSRVTAGQLQ